MKVLEIPDFLPHVGTSFRMSVDTRTLELELAEVHPLGPAVRQGGREGFSLLFLARERGHVPQATYALDHDTMGRLEIFLVPIGPAPDGRMRYEAVFN